MIRICFEGERRLDGSSRSSRVWSLIYKDDLPIGVYYAEWPVSDEPGRQVIIDLIMGNWGEGATRSERVLVSVVWSDEHHAFMIVDASARLPEYEKIAVIAMSRHDVVNSDIRFEVFQILDEIWRSDVRIEWR